MMPATHLTEIMKGIAAIDGLKRCDAVLSGYIGAPEQGEHILAIVQQVKQVNPVAVYLLDPVIGDPDKGCIVAPGAAEFHCKARLLAADIIAPNLLELE